MAETMELTKKYGHILAEKSEEPNMSDNRDKKHVAGHYVYMCADAPMHLEGKKDKTALSEELNHAMGTGHFVAIARGEMALRADIEWDLADFGSYGKRLGMCSGGLRRFERKPRVVAFGGGGLCGASMGFGYTMFMQDIARFPEPKRIQIQRAEMSTIAHRFGGVRLDNFIVDTPMPNKRKKRRNRKNRAPSTGDEFSYSAHTCTGTLSEGKRAQLRARRKKRKRR